MSMNLVNFFMQPSTIGSVTPAQTASQRQSAGNPFLSSSSSAALYAKNAPVKGGYFAGYYNGKPNIVGQRLFIEV